MAIVANHFQGEHDLVLKLSFHGGAQYGNKAVFGLAKLFLSVVFEADQLVCESQVNGIQAFGLDCSLGFFVPLAFLNNEAKNAP